MISRMSGEFEHAISKYLEFAPSCIASFISHLLSHWLFRLTLTKPHLVIALIYHYRACKKTHSSGRIIMTTDH